MFMIEDVASEQQTRCMLLAIFIESEDGSVMSLRNIDEISECRA
jgi:hypothetical protein